MTSICLDTRIDRRPSLMRISIGGANTLVLRSFPVKVWSKCESLEKPASWKTSQIQPLSLRYTKGIMLACPCGMLSMSQAYLVHEDPPSRDIARSCEDKMHLLTI